MNPKYSSGSKVRIKAQDLRGRALDRNIQPYENMAGEVVESNDVVGFVMAPWANQKGREERIIIYHYTVRINDKVTLHRVLEEFLEKID